MIEVESVGNVIMNNGYDPDKARNFLYLLNILNIYIHSYVITMSPDIYKMPPSIHIPSLMQNMQICNMRQIITLPSAMLRH